MSKIGLKKGRKNVLIKMSSKKASKWTSYLDKMALQVRQSTSMAFFSFIINNIFL
jgi:hypothetical protein